LLISAMLGLVVGIAVAFLRESIDDTFKSTQEVERFLQLPHLTNLPNLPDKGKLRLAIGDRLTHGFRARRETRNKLLAAWCAESYRALRNYLRLSGTAKPPGVVLVTSALNSEGKTVVAVNTATSFAQAGVRVLLIDSDLRRPRCHEMLKTRNECGLSQVLAGDITLEKAIVVTPIPGLSILPAGAIPRDSAKLLGSIRMLEVLTQLRDMFDFIVIDSAPTMLVSDVIPLSTIVDATVLVVDSRKTRRRVVMEACSRLRAVGATLAGVILNRVSAGSPDFLYASYYFWHYGNSCGPKSDITVTTESMLGPVVPYVSTGYGEQAGAPRKDQGIDE
jgi:polysaccharide biosynthesis transport protein